MTNIPLYTAIGLVAISLAARAEDLSTATAPLPPGTFTTRRTPTSGKLQMR